MTKRYNYDCCGYTINICNCSFYVQLNFEKQNRAARRIDWWWWFFGSNDLHNSHFTIYMPSATTSALPFAFSLRTRFFFIDFIIITDFDKRPRHYANIFGQNVLVAVWFEDFVCFVWRCLVQPLSVTHWLCVRDSHVPVWHFSLALMWTHRIFFVAWLIVDIGNQLKRLSHLWNVWIVERQELTSGI